LKTSPRKAIQFLLVSHLEQFGREFHQFALADDLARGLSGPLELLGFEHFHFRVVFAERVLQFVSKVG
jgi:hypothetical protein